MKARRVVGEVLCVAALITAAVTLAFDGTSEHGMLRSTGLLLLSHFAWHLAKGSA